MNLQFRSRTWNMECSLVFSWCFAPLTPVQEKRDHVKHQSSLLACKYSAKWRFSCIEAVSGGSWKTHQREVSCRDGEHIRKMGATIKKVHGFFQFHVYKQGIQPTSYCHVLSGWLEGGFACNAKWLLLPVCPLIIIMCHWGKILWTWSKCLWSESFGTIALRVNAAEVISFWVDNSEANSDYWSHGHLECCLHIYICVYK